MNILEETLRSETCRISSHLYVIRLVEFPRSQLARNRSLLSENGHVYTAQRIDFSVVISCVCWFKGEH